MTPAAGEALADEFAARYAAAVRARDVAAFVALYDPDVRVFDAWNRYTYAGAAAWREVATQWFGSLGEESVEVTVRRLGCVGDAGLLGVTALITYGARSPSGELLRSMDSRLTWLLTARDGPWRIVHEHSSNPLDDATLKGVMQLPPGS